MTTPHSSPPSAAPVQYAAGSDLAFEAALAAAKAAVIALRGYLVSAPPADPAPTLGKRFVFQSAHSPDQTRVFRLNSQMTLVLAELLTGVLPEGRQRSLALTALEEVRMRANAAVAVDWTGRIRRADGGA